MQIKTGLGQDTHRFETAPGPKPLRIGGVTFEGEPALHGNSDADVLLHALTNAISGVTGEPVLGPVADAMCKEGITDSAEYVREALKHLRPLKISHVSCSLECARPKIGPRVEEMRAAIGGMLGLAPRHIVITAHSGEGLTAFGKGDGIAATVIITAFEL